MEITLAIFHFYFFSENTGKKYEIIFKPNIYWVSGQIQFETLKGKNKLHFTTA